MSFKNAVIAKENGGTTIENRNNVLCTGSNAAFLNITDDKFWCKYITYDHVSWFVTFNLYNHFHWPHLLVPLVTPPFIVDHTSLLVLLTHTSGYVFATLTMTPCIVDNNSWVKWATPPYKSTNSGYWPHPFVLLNHKLWSI